MPPKSMGTWRQSYRKPILVSHIVDSGKVKKKNQNKIRSRWKLNINIRINGQTLAKEYPKKSDREHIKLFYIKKYVAKII